MIIPAQMMDMPDDMCSVCQEDTAACGIPGTDGYLLPFCRECAADYWQQNDGRSDTGKRLVMVSVNGVTAVDPEWDYQQTVSEASYRQGAL